MAERGEGSDLADTMLPGQVTLDALCQPESMEGKELTEEVDESILGNILGMEGTAADLKEEESSIMEALAECGGALEEADEDFEEGDEEEGDDSDDEAEDDDDDEEDEEEQDESEDEETAAKGLDVALDFGEMPDFSSMMEAETASILEGAVAADLGIKTEPDSELMDIGTTENTETASDKGTEGQAAGKKLKRKRTGKDKGKKAKKTKGGKGKKKKKKSEQDSQVDSKSFKASDRRRNIRKIIGEKDLEKETLDAQKEEFERQQRLLEQKRQAMSSMAAAASSKTAAGSAGSGSGASAATATAKVQDPQLKSLLQSAEEEAVKIEKREDQKKKAEQKPDLIPASEIKKEVLDEEEVEEKKEKLSKVDVIELSSDSESDDDDCVMVQSSEEEDQDQVEEPEDVNDGGAHINDDMNCRDDEGRVLVNVGHPAEDPDIFLAPQMARAIKPHQIGGVRFLYDNLVESLARFKNSPGFGCILAHSMGLGKTIQVISFVDIFLRHTEAKKVLCIVPINTLQNWMAEFNMWDPAEYQPPPPQPPGKAKDGGKKAEKKPRERSKKTKEPNSKAGGKKGAKGKGASPAECSADPGQNLMGETGLGMGGLGSGTIGPPPMGSGMGQDMNMFGRPGMGPMGNMGQMGNMGPMGGNMAGGDMGSMGCTQGQVGGSHMDLMRNTGLGSMAGPHVGQNNFLDSPSNSLQGMNVSQIGSCGGGFHEVPWMNSPMGQPSGLPFGSSQYNPNMRMSAPSNQSCMSSASPSPYPCTGFGQCPGNPKDFGPYGSPVASFGTSSNASAINSSGHLTNMSRPASSNQLGSVGSLMEADRWNRADNSVMGMDSASLSGSCPSNLMDASLDASDSAGGLLGMSCGSPMSRLSSNSPMNGPGTPHSAGAAGGGELQMDRLPVEDGLERFMGSGGTNGGNGGGGMGMGVGIASSSSPLPPVASGMCANPPTAQMGLPQVSGGSPSMVNPGNNVSPSSVPTAGSLTSAGDAKPSVEMAKESLGSSGDVPFPPEAGAPSPSPNTEAGKDSGGLDKGKPEDEVQSEGKEGENTSDGQSGAAKDAEAQNEDGKAGTNGTQETEAKEIRHRNFKIFLLNDSCKATAQRAKIIGDWNEEGGVLLMGYEMYRLLSNRRSYLIQPKKRSRAKNCKQKLDVIDVDEEEKNKELLIDIHGALVNPGPDLVVCDEGHRIKNNHASISQALKQIRTKRRVVLTGYPLQNNLMEYWCMVDFVRPNFLGNKTEFSNMFERPIMNGQCQDSTAVDRKLMKHRAYVLHSLLSGFVQRRSHVVLQRALPLKHEYVFMVRMSPIQRKLYRRYIDSLEDGSTLLQQASTNPLKAFSVGCKIWNHPDILHKSIVLKKPVVEDNDLDIEAGEGGGAKKKLTKTESSSSLASMASTTSNMTLKSSTSTLGLSSLNLDVPSPGSTKTDMPPPEAVNDSVSQEAGGEASTSGGDAGSNVPGVATAMETGSGTPMGDKKDDDQAWVGDAFEDYEEGMLEHGPKMVLLNSLIEEALSIGSKILVFSQSLSTLDTIEEFLSKRKVPRPDIEDNWARNVSYFRLDGSTSGLERERLINDFNRPSNKSAWVFLLSTKAGCLGINLIGANRAVVLDASWNPCHDCQAVCRIFRFGQIKECYIYRLVTENTLERNIYDRQITKQGMSDRVVDEINVENPFSRRQLQNLLKNEDKDFPYINFSQCEEQYDDPVLVSTLKKQGQWITKEPFTHESLLIDRKELRMSSKEKRLAREGYARDKRNNVTYSRPSYAAYYPGGSSSQMYIRRTPQQLGGIRPMMSTPAPRPNTHIIKPGVSVQQVITTTDIVLPGTNTATESGGVDTSNKIAAGQKILVIKTPKGVYIRTNDGKMFAVRSKGDEDKSKSDSPMSIEGSIGGTSTTTTTSTTVSSGGGGAVSSASPGDYLMGLPGRGRGAMYGASYSLPTASRHMKNMYSMGAHYNPAIRARGARPMIRPAFSAPGQSRSRAEGAGKAIRMGGMGFPFSEGLSPRRPMRGRGDVMGPYRIRAPGPYGISPGMSGVPRRKSPTSAGLPPYSSKQPDLSSSSQMMKLLASDDDGERVALSPSLQAEMRDQTSGSSSSASASTKPDSFLFQDRAGRGTGGEGDMDINSDMDSDRNSENSRDMDLRREMEALEDMTGRRGEADVGHEDDRRREMLAIRRGMNYQRQLMDMGKDAGERREMADIKMESRKQMEDMLREMDNMKKAANVRKEPGNRREITNVGREMDGRRVMGDIRRDVDSGREMAGSRRELVENRREFDREMAETRREMDSRREMADIGRDPDTRLERADLERQMADVEREMESRREMDSRKEMAETRREMADTGRGPDKRREIADIERQMADVQREMERKREMAELRRERMVARQMGDKRDEGPTEDSRDLEDSRDMHDSGEMDDDMSALSSPGSYSNDMMEELMALRRRQQGSLAPEGWDMDDMDDFSPGSSNSSFSQQMGMGLPPEDSSPGSAQTSQRSGYSPMLARRHFNMSGRDDQQLNMPDNSPFLRDQESLRGQPALRRVMDQTEVSSPQPPQSMVHSPNPAQSMVRSPQPSQSMVHSPQSSQSVVRSPHPPQMMGHSPQPTQTMVHSPLAQQAMVRSPLASQTMAGSPHAPQSHVHSPLSQKPASPHSPSPGPSSQQTVPSASYKSHLSGNGQGLGLGAEGRHAVSGSEAASSPHSAVSTPAASFSSFRGLPYKTSQHGRHPHQSAGMPALASRPRGSHHQPLPGRGRAQGRPVSYPQQHPSAAQPGQQRVPTWGDRVHPESMSSSPHLQAPESWEPSDSSYPSPPSGSQSPQERNPAEQVSHRPLPHAEDGGSPFSASQGDSPMSEEWMNSPDWFVEGSMGASGDQRHFAGQVEGDPSDSAAPQSLSSGAGMEDFGVGVRNNMARYQPTWTSAPPPSLPPPRYFGQTPIPANNFWHSAENQHRSRQPETHCQPRDRRGRGDSTAPFPRSGKARTVPYAPPIPRNDSSDLVSRPYPSHPHRGQSGPGYNPTLSRGARGELMDFALPQGVGMSSQAVSSYRHEGGRAQRPSAKKRQNIQVQRQNVYPTQHHRRGAETRWYADPRSLGVEHARDSMAAYSYSNRADGRRACGRSHAADRMPGVPRYGTATLGKGLDKTRNISMHHLGSE